MLISEQSFSGLWLKTVGLYLTFAHQWPFQSMQQAKFQSSQKVVGLWLKLFSIQRVMESISCCRTAASPRGWGGLVNVLAIFNFQYKSKFILLIQTLHSFNSQQSQRWQALLKINLQCFKSASLSFCNLSVYNILIMLGETKKSASIRKSAKLPKLNIQQQIDNQEIAERMNRKIHFAKNPRHLNQTISYAQAFATTEGSQSKFRVQPEQLFFGEYDTNHIYESEVKLINNSKYIQRIKITPLKQRQFVLASVKYPIEGSGDIAPGMAVTISIRFRPSTLNDYEDELLLISGDGVIRVPIVARRERCQIGWPKKIECGHCWVGDSIKKEIILKNGGGDGKYRLIGSQQDANELKVGCFKVTPTKLSFDRNMQQRIVVEFVPETKGVFRQTIKYKTNEGDQQQIEIALEGGAYSAQIVLEELNNQRLLEQKVNNTLFIEDSEAGRQSTANLKVRNLAVVEVDYFWYFTGGNITVDRRVGKMKPSQLLDFKVVVKPQKIIPQTIKLDLFLYNLPQKSLAGNVVSKNIDGKQAIQCLSINVKTKPVQSSVQVYPLHRQIIQPLYQNFPVTEWVRIVNNSSVRRSFKIQKICEDQGLKTSCSEYEGVLNPSSEKEISISFNLVELTKYNKKAHYLVSFDNAKSQIFSIAGKSTYPEVIFKEEMLYYGLIKTFTLNKRRLTLRNPQKTPIEVRIGNEFRYYMLDFYDFYDFEDESCYKKRFNIYNSATGLQLVDTFNIAPEGQIVLDCYFNAMGEESVDFQVAFSVINGQVTKVKVMAEVQDVHASLNRTSINMRQIYKGNVYNSNKFLSKQLQIVNEGNHACAFEIIPPESQQCDIKISPLKGIVQKDSFKRIDLLIEPIKTGDFDINIKWKYFDDFKINPDLYLDMGENVRFNDQDGQKSRIKESSLQIHGTIKGMAMNYYIKDDARAKKIKVKPEDGMQSVKLSNSSYQASSYKGSQKFHQNQKLVYPILEELNFYNCEINQVKQVQIIIENDSGLTTQYEVYAQEFHTIEKSPEKEKKNSKGLVKVEEEPFSSEMGRTFIKNRALDRSQKIHLGNNKGISILCQPASGFLHKKQSQKILITMFNDTSGRFRDNLLICVKNHETKKIPIDIHIKGTPVSLSRNQLGIDFNQQIPYMNLGTILHSNGLVKKSIKVVNNGPKEVELKWLVYPYNKVDKEKDIFKITFEDAVPGSGNIVQLKWNALKPEVDKTSYFSIEPKERIIKGREEVTFTVMIQQIKEVGEFSNLLICEPYLNDGQKRTEMESLAVVVKTETIDPVVTMDVEHKNTVNLLERFATAPEEYQTDTNFFERVLKLKNNLNTNLTFDVAIKTKEEKFDSFKLVQTKTNSPATTFTATKKEIQTSFVLTPGSILEAKVQLTGNPLNFGEWPLEQKIRRQGELVLSYSNGIRQVIPLVGWIYRPWVQIQMPNHKLHSPQNFQIDFGTVHIKNSRKETIYLTNPSKVDGKWTISYIKYHQSIKYKFEQSLWTSMDYEDQIIQDEKKCWRLSQDSGVVKNRTIPVHYMPTTLALPGQDDQYAQRHRPVQVQIMFKPQANVLYKSKFRLSVSEGPTLDIVVKGRGSYEEQLQKK